MSVLSLVNPPPQTKRQKMLRISQGAILRVFAIPEEGVVVGNKRVRCTQDSIPESAKAVGVYISDIGEVCIVVEDDSFPEISDMHKMPEIAPRYSWELIQPDDESPQVPLDRNGVKLKIYDVVQHIHGTPRCPMVISGIDEMGRLSFTDGSSGWSSNVFQLLNPRDPSATAIFTNGQ